MFISPKKAAVFASVFISTIFILMILPYVIKALEYLGTLHMIYSIITFATLLGILGTLFTTD